MGYKERSFKFFDIFIARVFVMEQVMSHVCTRRGIFMEEFYADSTTKFLSLRISYNSTTVSSIKSKLALLSLGTPEELSRFVLGLRHERRAHPRVAKRPMSNLLKNPKKEVIPSS